MMRARSKARPNRERTLTTSEPDHKRGRLGTSLDQPDEATADGGMDEDKNSVYSDVREFGDMHREPPESEQGDDMQGGNDSDVDKKPTTTELIELMGEDTARDALLRVYHMCVDNYHDELKLNVVAHQVMGRLSKIEMLLPTYLLVFPPKGSAQTVARQTLSDAYERGHFGNSIRGINNFFEAPSVLECSNADPKSVNRAANLVVALNSSFKPMIKGSSQARRQNDQCEQFKFKLLDIRKRYDEEHQCGVYKFEISWPTSRTTNKDADSWCIQVAPEVDSQLATLVCCQYDHDHLKQMFRVDGRVRHRMGWIRKDLMDCVDFTVEEMPMFQEKILWHEDRAPVVPLGGKKLLMSLRMEEKGGVKGQRPVDVTPPRSQTHFSVGQQGVPPSMTQPMGTGKGQNGGKATMQMGFTGGGAYSQLNRATPTNLGKGPRPGDWNCPNCQDYNFGRNSACRRCGVVKPMGQANAGGGMQQSTGKGAQSFPFPPPPPSGPPPSYSGGSTSSQQSGPIDIQALASLLAGKGIQLPATY